MAWHRCKHKRAIKNYNAQRVYSKNISAQGSAGSYFTNALSAFLLGIKILVNWLAFLVCLVIESIKLLPGWIINLFYFCPFKKNSIPSHVYNIGHRGAAAYEVENTIPACEFALTKYNANAIEIDISFTADKEVVLWHDWDPDNFVSIIRQIGLEPGVKYRPLAPENKMRKHTHNLTLEELRKHYGYALRKSGKVEAVIPTLDQFLKWAVSKDSLKMVILDVKIPQEKPEFVAPMLTSISELIETYQPEFKVILMSPYSTIIDEMKKTAARANYTLDIELPAGIVLDPPAYSAVDKAVGMKNHFASAGRPTILQLGPWTTYRRLIKYDLTRIEKLKDTAEQIETYISWTIDKKREMRCLLKMGVNAILTNRPDSLAKIYKKLK